MDSNIDLTHLEITNNFEDVKGENSNIINSLFETHLLSIFNIEAFQKIVDELKEEISNLKTKNIDTEIISQNFQEKFHRTKADLEETRDQNFDLNWKISLYQKEVLL